MYGQRVTYIPFLCFGKCTVLLGGVTVKMTLPTAYFANFKCKI